MIEDEKRSLVFGHVWCNDSDVQPRDYIKEECRKVHTLVGRLSVFYPLQKLCFSRKSRTMHTALTVQNIQLTSLVPVLKK